MREEDFTQCYMQAVQAEAYRHETGGEMEDRRQMQEPRARERHDEGSKWS
jgi:hypothetical protein